MTYTKTTTSQRMTPSLGNNRQRLSRTLLALILLVTTIRLIGYIVRFIGESLQMDFAAFYTAGEALNAGLSPYRTHLQVEPPIWDGRLSAASYRQSHRQVFRWWPSPALRFVCCYGNRYGLLDRPPGHRANTFSIGSLCC